MKVQSWKLERCAQYTFATNNSFASNEYEVYEVLVPEMIDFILFPDDNWKKIIFNLFVFSIFVFAFLAVVLIYSIELVSIVSWFYSLFCVCLCICGRWEKKRAHRFTANNWNFIWKNEWNVITITNIPYLPTIYIVAHFESTKMCVSSMLLFYCAVNWLINLKINMFGKCYWNLIWQFIWWTNK